MGFEEFERQLADKQAAKSRKRSRSRSRDRHHSKSSKRDHESGDGRRAHRSSRGGDGARSHHRRKHSRSPDKESRYASKSSRNRVVSTDNARPRKMDDEAAEESEDEWVEKESNGDAQDDDLDDLLEQAAEKGIKRDAWMEGPNNMHVETVKSRREDKPKSKYVKSSTIDSGLSVQAGGLLISGGSRSTVDATMPDMPSSKTKVEVDYEFGDAGSSWRMMKLEAVYRQSKENGKSVDKVALERFGNLEEFDDAREEESELDRRKMYGSGPTDKSKPDGELYRKRLQELAKYDRQYGREHSTARGISPAEVAESPPISVDQNTLNKMKAQLMRARLKGGPDVGRLEVEYNAAAAAGVSQVSNVVILNTMENRQLAGGRTGEVAAVDTKRGRERGLVVGNEDMTIEDMIKQERKTKGRNEGMKLAEQIGRDDRFKDGLDYLDDNAEKLAKSKAKSDTTLRSMAIADFQRTNQLLDKCPLCHHEEKTDEKDRLPTAPVISLATRCYLTLPTSPEVGKNGAVIVPLEHHTNLLECDEDEWEEIRNFMKCLTRMYHSQKRGVLFYENAAAPGKRRHAAMVAVPLPLDLFETAPAYFREAFMVSDEEWSQHKKVIDTQKAAKERGLGRRAFVQSIAKEAPYFHVWISLDGGLGHIVEDEGRWPRGDLFAREILGGMFNVEPQIYKRQGRWIRDDSRLKPFKAIWEPHDWTKILTTE